MEAVLTGKAVGLSLPTCGSPFSARADAHLNNESHVRPADPDGVSVGALRGWSTIMPRNQHRCWEGTRDKWQPVQRICFALYLIGYVAPVL